MSMKSGSRLSVTQASETSRPSILRSAKPGSTLRAAGGSGASLLFASRGSAAYRIGKTGFKVPRYQNSYRLDPYHRFNCEIVEKILDAVMIGTLTGMKYNPAVCLKLCQDMSVEVRSRIYKKDFDRYKYIVTFSIFEKLGQAINVSTGRLGDVERDTYCTRSFENTEFVSIGTVFGVYYE